MPEIKRVVHLLKRGFQVQKVSVINNLDRYMTEAGANEELYSLIIVSRFSNAVAALHGRLGLEPPDRVRGVLH